MMATAFLGYQHSPKWFKLNLYSIFNVLLSNITHYYNIFFLLLLFLISFTIFYFDNLKLSSVYSMRYFQIFSIIGALLTLIITIYDSINIIKVISHVNDNEVNVHGHIILNREAAKEYK